MRSFRPLSLLLALCAALLPAAGLHAQTTRNASNFAELQAAVTASAASGDTINLTNDIVVTAQVTLSKSLTVQGNGRTISVPIPGLDESGVIATSPSTHRVFTISGAGVSVRVENLTLRGGTVANGGAINVASGSTLRLIGSTVERSRSSSGGGGVWNGGTTIIGNSRLRRNSASFGGGFINTGASATLHIDRSLLAENRSESPNGGGGGGENASGATLFVNNSTFSNNQSTEIGGGINNFSGTMFVLNSTFSGNVGYGPSTRGGAIGVNGGTVRLVNNIFAYNYVRTGGTAASPTL